MLKLKIKRKVFHWLRFAVQAPRILFYRLLSDNRANGHVLAVQALQLTGLGAIEFKNNVRIGFFPSPQFFSTYAYIEARYPGSKISIGDNTKINNNFRAIAEFKTIEIGRNCLIGANVEILDSDFHGLKVSERNISLPESAASVLIGNDVFIGNNAVILKGVTVGDGAVISNSSLVVSDVPAHTIVGGVPAKVIRAIE
jgi:acetyltransferase-like isoleucine patch superfamily enzyme